MKPIYALLVLGGLILGQVAEAADAAGYYRVWQGSRKADLSRDTFNGRLPAFMTATTLLYAPVLNNYLVAVPPVQKPVLVPDEFALVALRSEADYQTIRATSQGQRYSDMHWVLFDRSRSQSAPRLETELPRRLESGIAYDLSLRPTDWSSGQSTFFLGIRKRNVPAEIFLERLSRHIAFAKRVLGPMGLKGYIVLANANYEAAFINWPSAEMRDRAMATPQGQAVMKDAAEIMDMIQWSDAEPFNGKTVEPGKFYNTRTRW